MANRNFPNSRIYTGHVMPVLLDCNFVVDSANGNGLGIRSLKGPYVQNVFMHTSATPAAGNPNPEAGVIVVQLQDNYSRIYTGGNSIVSPVSGSALQIDASALTQGAPYIITTLGNATAAQWAALGLPIGVTPAVGASFIAASVGAGPGTSTSRVMAPAAAGSAVMSIETIGDSNQAISPNRLVQSAFGAQLILACRNVSGAIAAPVDGSVISLSFLLSNSSIKVGNE